MAPHLIETCRKESFRPEIALRYSLGQTAFNGCKRSVQAPINRALRGEMRFGFGYDFDGTIVPTNEKDRIFFFMDTDPVGCIRPLSGLMMLDIPGFIISGNTEDYIRMRCLRPITDVLVDSPFPTSISSFAGYALNGGYATFFDSNGTDNSSAMTEYNDRQKMPEPVWQELRQVMRDAVRKAEGYPFGEAIPIRSGLTESETFAPFVQNRARGVQMCVIGVHDPDRGAMIDIIKRSLSPDVLEQVSIEPGGEYSIDGQSRDLHKQCAGQDAASKERFNLDWTFYFGDAVYKRGDKVGNDFSMVGNQNTTVLACNQDAREVPKHRAVSWIGPGAEATRNWLTWFLIERANNMIREGEAKETKIWDILRYIGFSEQR